MAITYMSGIQLPMQALVYKAPQTTNAITAHMFGMFLPSLFSGHRPYPKVLGSLADGLLRISYPSIWRQFIFYRYVSCYLQYRYCYRWY